MPGFGGTGGLPNGSFSISGYAKWVNDFLGVLGIDEPAVVMGHSFGGGVAVRFAYEHRAKVRSLVLVNALDGYEEDGVVLETTEESVTDDGTARRGTTAIVRFATPTIGREWMIGSEGEAVDPIDPDGIAVVGSARWRARTNRATPIAAGDGLRVVAIDGVTLEVEPLEGAARDYRERRAKS